MALHVWEPLSVGENVPTELLGEVYRSLAVKFVDYRLRSDEEEAVRARVGIEEQMFKALADPSEALALLSTVDGSNFVNEATAVAAVSGVAEIFDDYEDEEGFGELRIEYVRLASKFMEHFSLRYGIDPAGRMWITWPGVASSLFHQIREHAGEHDATRSRFEDFEMALADCVANPRTDKIETVLAKQMNLLETSGMRHPSTTQKTLGKLCNELETWPHEQVKEVTKSFYGFASDYPGVRHGGTFEAANRELDLGDLAAFASALLGLSIYLNDDIRPAVEEAILGVSGHKAVRDPAGPSGPFVGVSE